MTTMNTSKIRPGDTVRVRYLTDRMRDSGVGPVEFSGTVYGADNGPLFVGGQHLRDNDLTILEHTPARPDWADALVVSAAALPVGARHFLRDGDKFRSVDGAPWQWQDVAEHGPVAVVLDADGNPPEPAWLDVDALDKLPVGSVVFPKYRTLPRSKTADHRWGIAGHESGLDVDKIAPARVLWAPEDVL